MAKRVDSFTLPVSLKQAAEACRAAFAAGGWKVMDDSGHAFFVKERFDLWSYMFYFQSKYAIFLHKEEPKRTAVELHGSLHGVTPLQSSRLRKLGARLRDQITAHCPHAAEPKSNAKSKQRRSQRA